MIYELFYWLSHAFSLKWISVFLNTSFRIVLTSILSLFIAVFIGKKIILFLQRKQIGEEVRTLGLAGENLKVGTPTMGGIIIILSILIPTILFANLDKVYIRLMILCTIWLGMIGFLDDALKLKAKKRAKQNAVAYQKKDKDGLAGSVKIFGQVGLSIIIGATLYFNSSVTVERELIPDNQTVVLEKGERLSKDSNIICQNFDGIDHSFVQVKTPISTIPFIKTHEFNYARLISWLGKGSEKYTWIIYILIVTFIITAVSNGANLTDGLDGLASGISAIVGITLGVFIYLSSNYKFATYLNIMYIPNLGELSIFVAAFVGACIGFLWYNAYPAQVFMGDIGSLTLGGIIASLAIIVRKELLIPIFCGVFLVENVSVILQVAYFKYTKKKYGQGKRLLLMSPLHHHYQKKEMHENRIVLRFWIISILLALASILTLKLR